MGSFFEDKFGEVAKLLDAHKDFLKATSCGMNSNLRFQVDNLRSLVDHSSSQQKFGVGDIVLYAEADNIRSDSGWNGFRGELMVAPLTVVGVSFYDSDRFGPRWSASCRLDRWSFTSWTDERIKISKNTFSMPMDDLIVSSQAELDVWLHKSNALALKKMSEFDAAEKKKVEGKKCKACGKCCCCS